MITLLIRTSYRPTLFKRLLDSIENQTYKEIKIIVSYDNEKALTYIPEHIQKIRVYKNNLTYGYDNYCNQLMKLVTSGWFMFIDDDEFLYDTNALKNIYKHLDKKCAIICQMNRSGKLKPSKDLMRNRRVMRGKIGMPCIILNVIHKNIARFDGNISAADYFFIKDIQKKVSLKFVNIAVAYCDRRSHGQME